MPAPSWDLAITVIFLIGIAFGYILQRDKIVGTLLGVYVGLVVTQTVAGTIQNFFQGNTTLFNQVWIPANTNPFVIKAVLLGLVTVIVSTKANISGGRPKIILSPLEIIVYSVLTTGLILAALANFLPQDMRLQFILNSRMAKMVVTNYTWWIILPILFMLVSGFIHKDKKDSAG